MSVTGLSQASRTLTMNPNDYDHAIDLIDTTKPTAESSQSYEDSETPEGSGASLSRRWTKGTLRGELARRKYAKWQEDKTVQAGSVEAPNDENGGEEDGVSREEDGRRSKQSGPQSGRVSRMRHKVPFRSRRKASRAKEEKDYEFDILYENQRGAFWCGIPLYSAKSLLNFDPAGWQSASFHDSPVNIMNAQVPDPTWKWAWTNWYVDMSHDVDEEGWEYSFSFTPSFAWHGSHPWFHSFVRRRRWLRKRIKIHSIKHGTTDGMKAAHMLTADYFTIHPKREASPGSTGNRTTGDKSTNYTVAADELEDEDSISDITDLNALMAALIRARVDREKIAAITSFLDHGGDELYYLADRMPDVMAIFIYQTSRRQLHNLLLQKLDEATVTKSAEKEEDGEALNRKKENLLKAVQAAGIHVNDQDYWSDVRENTSDGKPPDAPIERKTMDATQPSGDPGQGPDIESPSTDIRDEIKGIPDDANTSEEPGIQWRQDSPSGSQNKGKEKA